MKMDASVQVLKGISYNFDNSSSLFEERAKNTHSSYNGGTNHGTSSLKELHNKKSGLLRSISDWKECPGSYKSKLHKKLQSIDISKKTALAKLDEMIREIGMLEFNLQLNPTWIHGLLKLLDEILDQSQRAQRDELIAGFCHLKEQFGLLKNDCSRYHLAT